MLTVPGKVNSKFIRFHDCDLSLDKVIHKLFPFLNLTLCGVRIVESFILMFGHNKEIYKVLIVSTENTFYLLS